jgi:hypothetical protein
VIRSIANCKLQIANCKLQTVKPRPVVAVTTITLMLLIAGGCWQKTNITQPTSTKNNPARSEVERGPVKVIAEVQPAVARLSDESVLTLTIEYEPGVEVEKPPFGTSLGSFLISDFHEPLLKTKSGRNIIQQVYTLEPTTTGKLMIDPISVTFIDLRPNGDQKTHTIQTEALTVEIGSMVGNDVPSLDNLRPSAGPLALPVHWPVIVWLAIAACVILGFTGLWWWRRSRHEQADTATVLSPEEIALMELDKLAQSGLAETDVKQFYVELTGIVRRYIEQTTAIRAPEQTTEEFLREISRKNTFDYEVNQRLRDFLESADLVKFAAHRPRREDVDESLSRARAFIKLKPQAAVTQLQEAGV